MSVPVRPLHTGQLSGGEHAKMNQQNKVFWTSLFALAIALTLLGCYLGLPLLWRADTDEDIAYRHASVHWALVVWAVAVFVWGWWSRPYRRRKPSSEQKSVQAFDYPNLGYVLGGFAFLGLLALVTAVRLSARP